MMKDTHIYLAAKAIELTRESTANTLGKNGKHLASSAKSKETAAADERQRFLRYYEDLITEASWAPDAVLHDNDPHHIFKLFTAEEFPKHKLEDKRLANTDKGEFFKFSGGVPYKVDHVALLIAGMCRLRNYNDQFNMKQIMYQYMLLSHYVVDAHVPMHCDVRDDPPGKDSATGGVSKSSKSKKPLGKGKWMKPTAHKDLEGLWDNVVRYVALDEGKIPGVTGKKPKLKQKAKALLEAVRFEASDCAKNGDVKVATIKKNGLMDFMVNVCIDAKIRGQALFPLENPQKRDDSILADTTRAIFAGTIGNLLSVWKYIWSYHQL